MSLPKIPVYKPLLEEEEKAAAREALDLGWLGMGSYVGAFEQRLGELVGAGDRPVVAVSTGHAALHLALLLAGCGPGDEVITPSFNNIADIQAIAATGARPVFCELREDTLCLDVDDAAALVGPATKAIIAMDYACHTCDHAAVADLAGQHGLRVVHDAAHALGSSHEGRPIGSISEITMFSFDPVKTITCIDGGALVVRDEAARAALHEMRLIGMKQSAGVMYGNARAWNYDVERIGFRYHLANLHAAIGLAQLGKFERIARTRRETFAAYASALSGIDGLHVPRAELDTVVPFMFYVRVRDGRREAFRAFLEARGIDTGIHWQPAHGFTLFRECRRSTLERTERVGTEIVSLPFHSCMATGDVDRVIETVRAFFRG